MASAGMATFHVVLDAGWGYEPIAGVTPPLHQHDNALGLWSETASSSPGSGQVAGGFCTFSMGPAGGRAPHRLDPLSDSLQPFSANRRWEEAAPWPGGPQALGGWRVSWSLSGTLTTASSDLDEPVKLTGSGVLQQTRGGGTGHRTDSRALLWQRTGRSGS